MLSSADVCLYPSAVCIEKLYSIGLYSIKLVSPKETIEAYAFKQVEYDCIHMLSLYVQALSSHNSLQLASSLTRHSYVVVIVVIGYLILDSLPKRGVLIKCTIIINFI